MSLDQKRARWFGVLFLITFATSIPALALYETVLRHPVSYIAGGRQLIGVASGMKSPVWPGGAQQSRILVLGLR